MLEMGMARLFWRPGQALRFHSGVAACQGPFEKPLVDLFLKRALAKGAIFTLPHWHRPGIDLQPRNHGSGTATTGASGLHGSPCLDSVPQNSRFCRPQFALP